MIIANDPLFADPFGLPEVGVVLLKVVVAFVFLLVAVMFNIWFLRKVISDMQNRIGPNLAGPWGILVTLADGVKLFFKEDLIPEKSHRFVFKLAPYLSLIPAFLVFAIVPVGGDFNRTDDRPDGFISIFGHDTLLQVADPPVGVLFFLAMSSLAIYGVMLAGWGSGSKYPLLGSVRASAQMVSYEAALGLSVASVVLVSGTLSMHEMVLTQAGPGFNSFLPNWNIIVTGFVPFFIFMVAGTAELNHPPFDLVEAEQELVGGFHTEYSSIRFALFYLAEFMNQITMGAIIVTLFLGGPAGPALFVPKGWWVGVFWFFFKLMLFLFAFVWLRATLPRLRYDQLMDLGWKLLIPVSLAWFLVLAGIQIGRDRGWSSIEVGTFAVGFGVVCMLCGALLMMALRSARLQRLSDLEEERAERSESERTSNEGTYRG